VILQSIIDFRSSGIMLSSRKKQALDAPAREISKVLYFKLTHYPKLPRPDEAGLTMTESDGPCN